MKLGGGGEFNASPPPPPPPPPSKFSLQQRWMRNGTRLDGVAALFIKYHCWRHAPAPIVLEVRRQLIIFYKAWKRTCLLPLERDALLIMLRHTKYTYRKMERSVRICSARRVTLHGSNSDTPLDVAYAGTKRKVKLSAYTRSCGLQNIIILIICLPSCILNLNELQEKQTRARL